ncbi:arginine repressor [Candidatus Epulonipiscium viviparus]|uniref:arginine repressor n=1 Tax=Candidatus Epulonipiscium viviparus TaxID=420336 RepID=UPI00016C0D7E|nr:arginine repressor [Candidatus Epulopiscium viviparus]
MGKKEERQSKILNLINEYNIQTQEELVENLEKAGLRVTQATISRDIRELKLTKIAMSIDKQKYIALNNAEINISAKVVRVFKAGFLTIDIAQNILVIKTLPGMSQAVASAIDTFNYKDIVGTIAGDDTIFCAIKDIDRASYIIKEFNKILNT